MLVCDFGGRGGRYCVEGVVTTDNYSCISQFISVLRKLLHFVLTMIVVTHRQSYQPLFSVYHPMIYAQVDFTLFQLFLFWLPYVLLP